MSKSPKKSDAAIKQLALILGIRDVSLITDVAIKMQAGDVVRINVELVMSCEQWKTLGTSMREVWEGDR